MEKKYLFIFLALMISLSLSCEQSTNKEVRGDDEVIGVSSEDAAMNKIIEDARASTDTFIKEFNGEDTTKTDFSVKYPFETDSGSTSEVEHIWLSNIEIDQGKYFGYVANDPFYISTLKLSDRVAFDIKKISDWKYIEKGYLVGGKSISYFYNQMSEKEKKEFEEQAGFKIKE